MQTPPFTHQDPAEHLYTITKSDAGAQPGAPWNKGIFIGGAGDVAIITVGGEAVVMTVPAGTYLRLKVARVSSASTTATLIYGFN